MTAFRRISIGDAGERIALARWGDDGSSKSPALLLHGTGLVAAVWDEVARELATTHTVYALDRRGPAKVTSRPPTSITSGILPTTCAP
jgi:pimeloyl-ACP methyl ester carboxylesterase